MKGKDKRVNKFLMDKRRMIGLMKYLRIVN